MTRPPGRPRLGARRLSNTEKQQRWRQRHPLHLRSRAYAVAQKEGRSVDEVEIEMARAAVKAALAHYVMLRNYLRRITVGKGPGTAD